MLSIEIKQKIIDWLNSFTFNNENLIDNLKRDYPINLTIDNIKLYIENDFVTGNPSLSIKFLDQHKLFIECKYASSLNNNPIKLPKKQGRGICNIYFELDCIMYENENADEFEMRDNIDLFEVEGNNVIGVKSVFSK